MSLDKGGGVMKRRRSNSMSLKFLKWPVLVLVTVFTACFLWSYPVSADAPCEEKSDLSPFSQTGGIEGFDQVLYKNENETNVSGWGDGAIHAECSGADCLLLPVSGANFSGFDSSIQSTNWMKSAVGGDFDGDGDDDLIVGGIDSGGCGQDGSMAFLPNETHDGDFATENVFTCGNGNSIKGLTADDYDGDGDLDVASYDSTGRVRIWFNNGSAIFANPNGVEYTNAAMDWETGIDSADINGDGDIDLILATSTGNGNVKYLENQGNGTYYEAQSIPVGFSQSNVVGLADFDQDGDMDFLVGSTHDASRDIKLYLNDGNENFTFDRVVDNTVTRPTFMLVEDFDLDGDMDFAVGTDGHNPSSNDGELFYFPNTYDGITVTFSKQGPLEDASGTPYSVSDFDNGGMGDFDGNGYTDIFVADGNNSQAAYTFLNFPTTTYVTDGIATSENVIDIDPTQYAVTTATLSIQDQIPASTSITYELSNDGGRNWFEVNAGNGWTINFPTYGADLRWRAILHTDDETVTPTIDSVDIDFSYVARTEFYRSEIIIDGFDTDENNQATLYIGSFIAPSDPSEGYLRKYLVQDIMNNVMSPIPLWTAAGNGINTVYSSNNSDVRCTLSAASCPEGNGLSAGEVAQIVSLPLGGIDHSAPTIVGEPVYPFWYYYYSSVADNQSERDDFMAFKNAHSNRTRVAYVGATDGMLHAIKGQDGTELWRYLPRYNKDEIVMNLSYPLTDDAKVDASPAVADVRFADSSWHTVLVCPLGRERNVVFALDVTDEMAPQVLWEFPGSISLGGVRSHPAILRMKVDGNTKYVALISSGILNDNQDGFAVYALDIETGNKIWEFSRSDCVDPTGVFLPASIAAIDSDYDGYVDRAYLGDFIGRLWEFTFDAAADSADVDGLDDDWIGSVLYTDPNGNKIYARPAVAFDSSGSLIVYFGTAGDANNAVYAIYTKHATDDTKNGTAKYTIGDGDGYIGNEKVYADPILNRGRATFVTSTGAVDTWAFCSESAGSSVIYTVSPGGGSVRTKNTAKTTSSPQADDGKTITVNQRGDFDVEDPMDDSDGRPPIPGDPPPDGSGNPLMRIGGWNQVYY